MKRALIVLAFLICVAAGAATAADHGSLYTVVYSGGDGVSVRSAPGGDEIIATAYRAPDSAFLALSPNTTYVNGIAWIPVRLSGWMARRNLRNGETNIATDGKGWGIVRWDGNGNPTDNFVSLRTFGDDPQRLAKVYYNTSIRIGGSRRDSQYEWVQAELFGWMAVKGPKGTTLIAPVSGAGAIADNQSVDDSSSPSGGSGEAPSVSSADKLLEVTALAAGAYILYKLFTSDSSSSASPTYESNEDASRRRQLDEEERRRQIIIDNQMERNRPR